MEGNYSTALDRRQFVTGGALTSLALLGSSLVPRWANAQAISPTTAGNKSIDLTIGALAFGVNGRVGSGIAINGSIPGPLLRFQEGGEARVRVANRLGETTSLHWHGLLVPPIMDGVPGVSFAGIPPNEIFEYRFPVRQSGTYWYHSHAGGQELQGVYGPLIIDPIVADPFRFDRDLVVVLSDWSFEPPARIIANLKKRSGYYNFQKRTVGTLLSDIRRNGLGPTLAERASWGKMRMDPTDFADVTGYTYTYLMNGMVPDANWTGLFRPGERVRLRFIAAGAMTYFDIRIPGLQMTIVQADGQNVKPVDVKEFRIAPGETFDVIVEPENRAYTLYAEAMDRSGFTRGTLAPRPGMSAPLPPRRPRPLRTMADMGMDMGSLKGMPGIASGDTAAMPGIDIAGGQMTGTDNMNRAFQETKARLAEHMAGMTPAAKALPGALKGPAGPGSLPFEHGPDTHGAGNSSVAMIARSRLDEPGSGFEAADGRVLVYSDLRSLRAQPDTRPPTREIEMHITGNMDRYMWSFDGKKYSEAETPIQFHYGERLRLIFVNDTMMEHPIHLHGMWMELENGAGVYQPRKHTISVKPAERLTMALTADAPGQWAMHCHLLLHMEMGMFRVVEVGPQDVGPAL